MMNHTSNSSMPALADELRKIDPRAELRRANRDQAALTVRKVAESSALRYAQVYRRVIQKRSVDLASANYAKVVRASFLYALERELEEAHLDSDLLQAATRLREFRDVTERRPGREGLADYFIARGFAVSGAEASQFRPRVPRVRRLNRLPEDWQDRMLEYLSTEIPLAREALIVLGLIGCRPEELKTARLELTPGGAVRIRVVSVKALSGVERGAEFDSSGRAGEVLHLCTTADLQSEQVFEQFDPKCLDNLLRRTSSRAFPGLHPAVCASCYRNQAASDLKRAGFPPEKIALYLGHTTTRQQKSYGRSVRGRPASRGLPLRIQDSHEVREVLRVDWESACEDAWEREADELERYSAPPEYFDSSE